MMKQSNMKSYYVYLMTNKTNMVIYIGVTNDLIKRVFEHKNKSIAGFTKKYNVNKLVHFEKYDDPLSAITREKQLKAGSRKKKLELVMKDNPAF
ncbi:MAG: GIY-YIG nuclease family protein [bacterium]